MKVKGFDLPFPAERVRCHFCDKNLTRPNSGLTICTTRGLAILTCQEHAEMGDWLVIATQMLAMRAKQMVQN